MLNTKQDYLNLVGMAKPLLSLNYHS